MPRFQESSSSESATDIESPQIPLPRSAQRIVADADYITGQLDGLSESPLSEQLEPIAVIGMGCRLPGDVKSTSELWDLLISSKSGRTPKVPESRFNIDSHYHENNDRPGSFKAYGGYFLDENLREFDPTFFNITPVEAMWMDPQQRKLLEVVYEAFESAGAKLEDVAGSDTAVFAASFTADFQQMSFKEPSFRHNLAATGVDPGIISNRISHVFNLRGPSIVVNTACSSSVYATHNACNALRNRECGAAVVGGVNLVLTVDQHMNTAKLGVLSPTSECHTFNSYADGYGRAEGVGAIYLKRLSDAIRHGDPIRGVIRSSATNNNGREPAVGITHPSFDGQRRVIKHAYERCGNLDPRLTGFFECHGTGTAIGDPLEVRAVASSMNDARTDADGPLLIGAVKASIGHSEAASGISAIIKAILIAERGTIPGTFGITDPNPKIDWSSWRVLAPSTATTFPIVGGLQDPNRAAPFRRTCQRPPLKRISINSFGYGGTNAHVIVESADSLLTLPQTYKYHLASGGKKRAGGGRRTFDRNRPFLLPFSAHEKKTLRRNIDAHGAVLHNYHLHDVSYTLANRRSRLSSRGFVVTSLADLQDSFREGLESFTFAEKKHSSRTGFVFTGQGAQWPRMGAELMAYYPSFLTTIRQLDLVLEDLEDGPDWTLEDALLQDQHVSRVHDAQFSQPLCTAIQIALVRLLRSWGIHPQVAVGHSSGEIAAAYCADLISASDAIIAAYYRGKVVKDLDGGAMLAVGMTVEEAESFLSDLPGVVIACQNSPVSLTLSGDRPSIEQLSATLTETGTFNRLLKTNGKAYHSPRMQTVSDVYQDLVRKATLQLGNQGGIESTTNLGNPRSTKMISSVTPDILMEGVTEAYWSANLTHPVLFRQAMELVINDPDLALVDTLIEVGPHSALAGPIKQIQTGVGSGKLHYHPTLLRGEDSAVSLLKLAGQLFLRDYPIDLERVTALEEISPSGKTRVRAGSLLVDLPPYQWDKKEFWAESRESQEHRVPKFPRHDVLGSLRIGSSLEEPLWRNVLRLKDLPWLKDHSLGGEAVFPAAGYIAMAVEAITQLNELQATPVNIESYTLRQLSIKEALVTPDDDNGIEVLFSMRPSSYLVSKGSGSWWDFHVSSISSGGYRKNHMSGSVGINIRGEKPTPKPIPALSQRASGPTWNQALKSVGFDYGKTFADIDNIRFDGRTYAASSTTAIKNAVVGMTGESRYVLHPACVDSCLQLMIVAIWAGRTGAIEFGAVPVEAREMTIWKPTTEELVRGDANIYSWIDPRGIRAFNAHSQLVTADGSVLLEIDNMRCVAYEAAIPQQGIQVDAPQPLSHMVWKQDVALLDEQESKTVAETYDLLVFKFPALSTAAKLVIGRTQIQVIMSGTAPENLSIAETLACTLSSNEFTKLYRDNTDVDLWQPGEEAVFDLVVAPLNSEREVAEIYQKLSTNGKAILDLSIDLDADYLQQAGLRLMGGRIQQGNVIVVTREQAMARDFNPSRVSLIYNQKSNAAVALVAQNLRSLGHIVESISLENASTISPTVVVMADLDDDLLPEISKESFQVLQSILVSAQHVLWVADGAGSSELGLGSAMSAGLLRAVRSERASLRCSLVKIDRSGVQSADVVKIVSRIFSKLVTEDRHLEEEYSMTEGQVRISRLLPNEEVNKSCFTNNGLLELLPFDAEKSLLAETQGGKVVFSADERVDQALGPDDVEVRVQLTGITDHDVHIMTGNDFSTQFGREFGGVVTNVGGNVSEFGVGSRVAGLTQSSMATYQRTTKGLVQELLSHESLSDVVSLPLAYCTALHGLERVACAEADETVLILPGSGVEWLAAVDIAKAIGTRPYVLFDTELPPKMIAHQYSLDASMIVSSSQMPQLRGHHGNYAFNIVLCYEPAETAASNDSWNRISPLGRFINCRRTAANALSRLDATPLQRGATRSAFDIVDVVQKSPAHVANLWKQAIGLFRQKAIRPFNASIVNIADLHNLSVSPAGELTTSKVLAEHRSSDALLSIRTTSQLYSFRPDCTYLLVGCLGGLGRSLTTWMLKRGARNFLFLSRSGTDAAQAALVVESLKTAGANVVVHRGDVTLKSDIENALKDVPSNVPVKGVVHAAMLLKDGIFENMSYEDWKTCTRPKVQGALNLHLATKSLDLDFFVMTSSVSGVLGTPGQSNYAAGNAYMDALASYRRSQGLPGTAIALPMVLGIGVVAENFAIEESLKKKGMYGIDEEEVLNTFEVALKTQDNTVEGSQLIAGLDSSLLRKAALELDGDAPASFWASDSRFSTIVHSIWSAERGAGSGSDSVLSKIKEAPSLGAAVEFVREHFIAKLARMLLLDLEEFSEESRSIASYGVDSMTGADLRNWIYTEYALDIPFQQLLSPSQTPLKFAGLVGAHHRRETVEA